MCLVQWLILVPIYDPSVFKKSRGTLSYIFRMHGQGCVLLWGQSFRACGNIATWFCSPVPGSSTVLCSSMLSHWWNGHPIGVVSSFRLLRVLDALLLGHSQCCCFNVNSVLAPYYLIFIVNSKVSIHLDNCRERQNMWCCHGYLMSRYFEFRSEFVMILVVCHIMLGGGGGSRIFQNFYRSVLEDDQAYPRLITSPTLKPHLEKSWYVPVA